LVPVEDLDFFLEFKDGVYPSAGRDAGGDGRQHGAEERAALEKVVADPIV
jgi:hypothetical protein